ncbi:transcriptional regulator [Anaeromicrobium sediminis]|uniref:Transcriptional regulator n=1 Tax=Anaeromicrobium sediminis TaxID=1478221 RepID=A0A267MN31_9FIRM|nr:transcriptional regulator [Anaeromicrobium sediminis]PAB60936.1 transcriptional regulator [Anaeromicrobium sediminis]
MFFYFRNKNKKISYLRKNMSYTAKELALKLKVDDSIIFKIDNLKLKEVDKGLREKLIPVFRGDMYDNIPW